MWNNFFYLSNEQSSLSFYSWCHFSKQEKDIKTINLVHLNVPQLINLKIHNSLTFARKVVRWNNWTVIDVETLNSSNPIWTIKLPAHFNVCGANSIYPYTLHFTNNWNINKIINCWIWGSQNHGYILGCNATQSNGSSLTVQKNVLPHKHQFTSTRLHIDIPRRQYY